MKMDMKIFIGLKFKMIQTIKNRRSLNKRRIGEALTDNEYTKKGSKNRLISLSFFQSYPTSVRESFQDD
jgi:hypothetical protein